MATPALDELARGGLRYNRFHVNSLCSPTRAALLSGRNDHEIGFGIVTEGASGYPGYNTIWPKSAASIAEFLKAEWIQHGRFRQVAQHPLLGDQSGGPIRPLAHRFQGFRQGGGGG